MAIQDHPRDTAADPSTDEHQDATLLRRFRDLGDRQALAAFYQRHAQRAWRLARRLAGNDADAEDALQGALVDVMVSIHTWRPSGSPGAWLLTVVANRVRMQLRGEERRGRREAVAAAASTPPATTAPGAEAEDVRAALDRLPERQRSCIWLRHGEGLSVAEVATMLDRPERTIRADIALGLARLRAQLTRGGAGMALPAILARTPAGSPPPALPFPEMAVLPRSGTLSARQRSTLPHAWPQAAGVLLVSLLTVAVTLAPVATAPAPPAPAQDSPVPLLEQPVTVPGRHLTLVTALLRLNGALPPGRSLPFAIEPALCAPSWSGVTLRPGMRVRDCLDAAAAAVGAQWAVSGGIVVFDRPLPPAARRPWLTPDAFGPTQATHLDRSTLRAVLLELPHLAPHDRRELAEVLWQTFPSSGWDESHASCWRPFTECLAQDAAVRAAGEALLAAPRVPDAIDLRVSLHLPPSPLQVEQMVAVLAHARPPRIQRLGNGITISQDMDDVAQLPALIALGPTDGAAQRLLGMLGHPGPQRRLAAAALGQMRSAAAVPLLLDTAQDPDDDETLRAAVEALGRIGAPAVAAVPLLESLAVRPSEMQDLAFAALAQIGDPQLPALLWSHLDVLEGVRTEAAADERAGLRRCLLACPPAAVLASMPPAPGRVGVDVELVRCQLGLASQLPRLLEDLHHPDPEVRAQAAIGIGRLRADAVVAPLTRTLAQAQDPALVAVAAEALGRIGSAGARRALEDACTQAVAQQRSPGCLEPLATALLRCGRDARAVAVVAAAMAHTTGAARTALARALGSGRTAEERHALLDLLHDPDPAVASAALATLVAGADLRNAWDEPDLTWAFPSGEDTDPAGTDPAGADAVRAAAADRSVTLRIAALGLVRVLPADAQARLLHDGLRDAQASVRHAAILALGWQPGVLVGDPRKAELLLSALQGDAQPSVRVSASRALFSVAFCDPSLQAAMRRSQSSDPDPAVRAEVAAQLQVIATTRAYTQAVDGRPVPSSGKIGEPPQVAPLATF